MNVCYRCEGRMESEAPWLPEGNAHADKDDCIETLKGELRMLKHVLAALYVDPAGGAGGTGPATPPPSPRA